MAKFAVVLFAVIAAASAGALMPYGIQGKAWGSYGYGLQGYPTGMHDNLFGLYTEKYGQHVYETPMELVNQIHHVVTDLSATFESSVSFTEQHVQLFSLYARHFAFIIKNVVHQLETYEHADTMIQEVIYNLREVYVNFEKLAGYGVSTDVHHFRIEFYQYIQIAVAQIDKLVMIAQQEHHGTFFYVIKDVLHFFLYGLYDIQYQLKEVVGLGQHYGMGYGYSTLGQGYGIGKYGKSWYKYGQYPYGTSMGYGLGHQYGMSYGLGHQYGLGYGLGSQYGMGYGLGHQYGMGYGIGKYTHGLTGLGQYGKGYGYGTGYQHMPYGNYWGSTLYNRVY